MFSFAMTFTSCSDEAFDVDSVNKQTILVYYPWTGSTTSSGLKQYLANNIDSICQGIVAKKGLSDSRVMVFFSEKYNKSTLYDLQYDAASRKVNRVPVKTYEDNSYCTAEGFANLLNEVKQNAEALNYALIIGVHGSGWTYAEDWVNYPNYARPGFGSTATAGKPSSAFSGIQFGSDPDHPVTRFFGSVNSKSYAMDIPTLAEGIRQSGLKMQYILFDACYMSNVETAYELKDATNFLLASPNEIMAKGLPYEDIWSYLNTTTPNYASIISSYYSHYNSTSTPYASLAAIDCRQMDKLAAIMKELNSKYTITTERLAGVQTEDGYTPNLYYDLGNYVDSLKPNASIKDQFATQLKATVKAAQSTAEVYSNINATTITVKDFSGLTISDPSSHPVALRTKKQTKWWKATHEGE